jgi:hypothetical protein
MVLPIMYSRPSHSINVALAGAPALERLLQMQSTGTFVPSMKRTRTDSPPRSPVDLVEDNARPCCCGVAVGEANHSHAGEDRGRYTLP